MDPAPNTSGPAPSASGPTKKRKRSASIIVISDTETESILVTEDLSDATDEDTPAPKRRNPTNISNYTPNARTLIRRGKNMFREKVLLDNAFPSRGAQARLGLESWEASRISLPASTAGKQLFRIDLAYSRLNQILEQ
jgi:hypothetical protein